MTHRFASHCINGQIFYHTKLCLGLVNLKPLVPGHVLVIPKRIVERYADLTTDEITDIFTSVQKIGSKLEKEYNATSLTISIQDGKDAGQSVPHVHAHVIPRRTSDFENNDDIYERMKVDDDERIPRSMEEMKAEASRLAALFGMQPL